MLNGFIGYVGRAGGLGGLQIKRKPENRFDVLNNSHVKYLASLSAGVILYVPEMKVCGYVLSHTNLLVTI